MVALQIAGYDPRSREVLMNICATAPVVVHHRRVVHRAEKVGDVVRVVAVLLLFASSMTLVLGARHLLGILAPRRTQTLWRLQALR